MKPGRVAWIAVAVVAVVVAVAVAAWFWPGATSRTRIVEGPAWVPVAGVLLVEDVWIPLHGLRTPREDPNCSDHSVIVQCPLISTAFLAELVMAKTIRCELHRFDGDDRNWGVCGAIDDSGEWLDGPDGINRQMVRSGWAVAWDHYTRDYVADGKAAREANLGVWTSLFIEDPARTGTLGTVNETPDAATVEVQETRVRMYGIDAPELAQTCTMNGVSYPCGLLASAHLNALITAHSVICHVDLLADGRSWGRCGQSNQTGADFLPGAPTLNEAMVLSGWAVANRGQSRDYIDAEDEARREKRGMWAGEFVRPADWRDGVR